MKTKFIAAFIGLATLFGASFVQAANPVVTGTWTGTLLVCTQAVAAPALVPITIVLKQQYANATYAANALVCGTLTYKMPGKTAVTQPLTGVVDSTLTFRATSDIAIISGTLSNFVSPYYRRINLSVLCPNDGSTPIEQQVLTGYANRK
ncbi:MAG: hypothetical protein WCP06_04450 [Verrucomicrobiota bacterium]